MSKPDKKTILRALLFLLLLIPAALLASFNIKYRDTAFPQVKLNGQSFSGLSAADAETLLKSEISQKYKDGMQFTYKDKTYTASLSDLGIQIDTAASVQQLFSYGHRADLLQSGREQFELLRQGESFTNLTQAGTTPVQGAKWQEMAKIETAGQDLSYKFNGKDFVTVAPQEGSVIDQDKLAAAITANLRQMKNDPIALELVEKDPQVKVDSDQQALGQARALMQKTVSLRYDSTSWKVAASDLGKWISFTTASKDDGSHTLALSPASAAIEDYITSLVPQINREPVNAQLEFKDGKVNVFSLSQQGVKVDTAASAQAVASSLFTDKNYASGEGSVPVDLVVKVVSPKLTTDNVDNMGITSLLSTGESNFHGSTTSRRHNIAVGASKFNGVLIGPGDQFSFDKVLGNVGAQEGYLPELVIKQGQTVPEYGGGLCQVSTTAFRAAVNAGLEVTERKNHAYAVKYYAPQGTDATIYPPSPDLKFVNNTPNYILIQTRVNGDNLYFDFYGTNDGRKVVTEGPVVYEKGDGGAMKTWWKQHVYDQSGKLFLDKTFYSDYKSPSLYPRKDPLE